MPTSDPAVPLHRALERIYNAADHRRPLEVIAAIEEAREMLEDLRAFEIVDAYESGISQAKIARALGVSRQAVSQQLARARERESDRQRRQELGVRAVRLEDGSIALRKEHRDGS